MCSNDGLFSIDWKSSTISRSDLLFVQMKAFSFEEKDGVVSVKDAVETMYFSPEVNAEAFNDSIIGDDGKGIWLGSVIPTDMVDHLLQVKVVYQSNGEAYKTGFYYLHESNAASPMISSDYKSQSITGAKATYTYKKSVLAKKAATFNLKAKAATALTYKVKSGAKYISVTKAGKVTIKKGTPKGNYKITITAKATSTYAKATKTVTIKVK